MPQGDNQQPPNYGGKPNKKQKPQEHDESLEKKVQEILAVKTIRGKKCNTPLDCKLPWCKFEHETPSGRSQKAERILEKAKKEDDLKMQALAQKPQVE